jgi:hypothetical protein
VSSPTVPAAGGTPLTIRGSGFQTGIKVTNRGKTSIATLVDRNTLTVISPPVAVGRSKLVLTNTNGETVSLAAAMTAD